MTTIPRKLPKVKINLIGAPEVIGAFALADLVGGAK